MVVSGLGHRGAPRWLAVLLLTALAFASAAMYAMHVDPAMDAPSAASSARASATHAGQDGGDVQIPVAQVPDAPCRSWIMQCASPTVPWHHLQTPAAAQVLMPSLAALRSLRFAAGTVLGQPPPSLTVLSISRT